MEIRSKSQFTMKEKTNFRVIGILLLFIYYGLAAENVKEMALTRYDVGQIIFEKYGPDLLSTFKNKNYRWVLNIQFSDNRFFSYPNKGRVKLDETYRLAHYKNVFVPTYLVGEGKDGKDLLIKPYAQFPVTILRGLDVLTRKPTPFYQSTLPKELSAQALYFRFYNPKVLGLIKLKHYQRAEAIELLKLLYVPKNLDEEKRKAGLERLRKTMIIVSGGSHGADEADHFAKLLEQEFKKQVDFIVLADSFIRTSLGRKTSLVSKGLESRCLHLFQRELSEILKGLPIQGCENYLIKTSKRKGSMINTVNHVDVARYANQFAFNLLVYLNEHISSE